jgi:hypothetical protein
VIANECVTSERASEKWWGDVQSTKLTSRCHNSMKKLVNYFQNKTKAFPH